MYSSTMVIIVERNRSLLERGHFSDVSFRIGSTQEPFQGHRVILASCSSFFKALFGHRLEREIIRIPELSPAAFHDVLKYIYINELPSLNPDNWTNILQVADIFEIYSLRHFVISYVDGHWKGQDFESIVHQALKHRVLSLTPMLRAVILIATPTFLNVRSSNALANYIGSSRMNFDEMDIFRIAVEWASQEGRRVNEERPPSIRDVLGPALYAIRFPRICLMELSSEIFPLGILSEREMENILRLKAGLSTPNLFPVRPRLRSAQRNSSFVIESPTESIHVIMFKASASVRIYGMELYGPLDRRSRFAGILYIQTVEGSRLLGDVGFDLDSNSRYIWSPIHFREPIHVEGERQYIAVLKLYLPYANSFALGINVANTVTTDDVEWNFEDESSSAEGNMPSSLFKGVTFMRTDGCI